MVKLKRIYDQPEKGDGKRVLVDRLWPRGVKKEDAGFDLWLKDIAPSDDLRKWFSHDPSKWQEFRERYRHELKGRPDMIEELKKAARQGTITLLYAAKDADRNNAVVLKEMIEK
ncbi:MAG: DUF488 domain-containing protein [Thermodesulfovibrionales bacterium]